LLFPIIPLPGVVTANILQNNIKIRQIHSKKKKRFVNHYIKPNEITNIMKVMKLMMCGEGVEAAA
jgi:hypothetical protein